MSELWFYAEDDLWYDTRPTSWGTNYGVTIVASNFETGVMTFTNAAPSITYTDIARETFNEYD